MQSLAQKKARENFKKAIEYRKKTGCSLKQAFAHIKGKSTVIKKTTTIKKVGNVTLKKSNRFVNDDRYIIMNDGKQHLQGKAFSKTTAKEIANSLKKVKAKRKIAVKKVGVIKKKAVKKPSEQSILNKIHKVKKDVERLDESQHKHMSNISGVRNLEEQRTKILKSINEGNLQLSYAMQTKIYPGISLKQKKESAKKIKWYKEHLKTLKLHLKEINSLISKSF